MKAHLNISDYQFSIKEESYYIASSFPKLQLHKEVKADMGKHSDRIKARTVANRGMEY